MKNKAFGFIDPGSVLPRGFPYAYWGDRSTGWDTAGPLVANEHVDKVEEIEGTGEPRRRWFKIRADGGERVLLCAIYGPQVDQEAFWTTSLDEIETVFQTHGGAGVELLVAGWCWGRRFGFPLSTPSS